MKALHRICVSLALISASAFAISACKQPDLSYALKPGVELSFYAVSEASQDSAALQAASKGDIAPGLIYRPHKNLTGGLILDETVSMKAGCMQSVTPNSRQGNRASLDFQLTERCTEKFAAMTTDLIGKQFAIVLNGEIISAPLVNSAITGGRGVIQGFDSVSELEDILNEYAQEQKAK